LLSQLVLFARHPAIIMLMIVTRQMQNAMQHQNLYFVRH
jgi:hypothetical protein